MNYGLIRLEHTVWTMTVLRVGIDANNDPCVDIRIEETGEKRRLYAGDVLKMHLDLPDKVEESQ